MGVETPEPHPSQLMAAVGGDSFFFGGVVTQKSLMLSEGPYLNAHCKSTDWTQEVLKTQTTKAGEKFKKMC